jgi:hypothetical protein
MEALLEPQAWGPFIYLRDPIYNCGYIPADITQRRLVNYVWNVMAHAQKPDFVFRRNVRVHLNLRGLQFSRLLAAEVCASAVVMLDTPCSEVVRRVLATHSIRQFPLHFPSCASPCAITFQLDSSYQRFVTTYWFRFQESSSPRICVTSKKSEDLILRFGVSLNSRMRAGCRLKHALWG